MSDFNWNDPECKDCIAIQSVSGVAVYRNSDGDVVIRQEDRLGGEDSFIVLPVPQVEALILALQNEIN